MYPLLYIREILRIYKGEVYRKEAQERHSLRRPYFQAQDKVTISREARELSLKRSKS